VTSFPLIPAQAGIQRWVPAFAGTNGYCNRASHQLFAIVVCFIAVCVGGTAHAHQVNLSTARVELLPDRTVSVVIGLKGSDADRLAGTQIFDAQADLADPARVATSAEPIAAYVSAHVTVTGTDGKSCSQGTASVLPDGDGVVVLTSFTCRDVAGDLVYRSTVLTASDKSARQVVLIGAGENAPQALLDDAHATLTISAPAPSVWSTMQRYLVTGIEHIFLGYDHIAFLVAIVLWARRLMPVIKVVTAFTIAHSITLSLAALQIVSFRAPSSSRRSPLRSSSWRWRISSRAMWTVAGASPSPSVSSMASALPARCRKWACRPMRWCPRLRPSISAWKSGRSRSSRSSCLP
jgi:hypothetical protein